MLESIMLRMRPTTNNEIERTMDFFIARIIKYANMQRENKKANILKTVWPPFDDPVKWLLAYTILNVNIKNTRKSMLWSCSIC